MAKRKRADQKGLKRADALTRRRRIDDFVRIRLDGAKFWDLWAFVREQEAVAGSAWFLSPGEEPMSDQQLYRYQQEADKAILASVSKDREKSLKLGLARRENLYAKAVTSGDLRTALGVLRDEAELRGLYPEKKPPARDDAPAPITVIIVPAEENRRVHFTDHEPPAVLGPATDREDDVRRQAGDPVPSASRAEPRVLQP